MTPDDSKASLPRRLKQKWLIWTVAGDADARRKLAMATLPPEPRIVDLRLSRLPQPIVVRHGEEVDDRRTVWELFRRKGYESPLWDTCETLFDVGGNAGLLPVWLAWHGKLPRRYAAVEADPDSAAVLRTQVERLPFATPPIVLEAAAGDEHKTVRFNTGGDSMFHGVSDAGGIEVAMKPVSDLMDEAGVDRCDVFKIDIEGGEASVFPDAARWAPRVRAIIAELHYDMDAAWLDKQLRPLGFRTFAPGPLVREAHAAVREDAFAALPADVRAKAVP